MGFEVRLFERMGVTDNPPRRRLLRPSRWVPAVVGVAAAALVLGLALGLTSSSPTPTPSVTAQPQSADRVVTAALVEHGKTVGHVMAVGGAKPWISMMLSDSSAHGTINCVVVTDDGVTHHVGTFVADEGYGAWIAPLHVDLADVRDAEVVSPSGTVIATATLG